MLVGQLNNARVNVYAFVNNNSITAHGDFHYGKVLCVHAGLISEPMSSITYL